MRRLHAGQHHVPDLLIAKVRAARERHPGNATAIDDDPALDPLAADGLHPACSQSTILGTGEGKQQMLLIDGDSQMRQLAQAGGDAPRGGQPTLALPCLDRTFRLPEGEQIATDGWTTRQGRFSIFVPLSSPLFGQKVIKHEGHALRSLPLAPLSPRSLSTTHNRSS